MTFKAAIEPNSEVHDTTSFGFLNSRSGRRLRVEVRFGTRPAV